MQNTREAKSSSVPAWLPWAVAAVLLGVYAWTLHRWLSLASLAPVAKIAGWDWVTPHRAPLLYLVTFPFRWLPASALPVCMNAFAAGCAFLSLGLLGRCVTLLPHDRTHDQRLRERSEFSLLSNRFAWLPPVLAILVCGLQLTFWEHATVFTGEMLDLAIFAYLVRCVLEYRLQHEDRWLYKMAVVYGLGVTNNWALIGFAPCFLVALIWIRGRSFFGFAFLTRMVALSLAGLSLYLLLPTVWALAGDTSIGFWDVLRKYLGEQKGLLLDIPSLRNRALLLSLTSLLPLVLVGIRWPTAVGDTSAAGAALTNVMYRVIHIALFAACLWVTFDGKFSPRALGLGLPFLTFYFVGALCIGYFAGYLTLVFSEHRGKNWRRSSAFSSLLNKVVPALVVLVLIVVPAGLFWKNQPLIQESNAPALRDLAVELTRNLPAQRAILLSDDASSLLLVEAHFSQMGSPRKHLLVHTRSMVSSDYHQQLVKRYPEAWPATLATTQEAFDDGTILNLMTDLSRTNAVYYLHPSFGYYFERFHAMPRGLVTELVRYPEEHLGSLPVPSDTLSANRDFWRALEPRLTALQSLPQSRDAAFVRSFLSRSMNAFGVTLARNGDSPGAQARFEAAVSLSTNNIPSRINLDYARLRASSPTSRGVNLDEVNQQLGSFSVVEAMSEGGPFDEPQYCAALGDAFANRGLNRQALIQYRRTLELQPDNLPVELAVARLHIQSGRPKESLAHVGQLRERHRQDMTETLDVELARIAASAEYALDHPAGAERMLQEVHARHPKNLVVLDGLVHLFARQKRFPEALAALDKLDQLAPQNAQVALNRATVFFNGENYDQALATLDAVLARDPKNQPVQIYKIFVLVQTGRHAQAAPIVESVLSANPFHIEALNYRGVIALEARKYDEALEALNLVLEKNPGDWNALRNRAVAYLQLDQLKKARADYLQLIQITPTYFAAYYGLGEIAYRQRDFKTALQQYQRYLRYFPQESSPVLLEEKRMVEARVAELQNKTL